MCPEIGFRELDFASMAKPSNTEPVTTPASTNPESKILELATAVITGEVFKDETNVVEFRKSFGTYLDGLKGIAKSFDQQLQNLRQANGDDFLPEVEYFRKPREDKKSPGNSLLDKLNL